MPLLPYKGSCQTPVLMSMLTNKVLKCALDNDGCRNSEVNEVIKGIRRCSRDQNFSIQTLYVPSKSNPADEPSRKHSDLDCMLSPEAWLCVERFFGPHSFDLMSLDSNCQRNKNGTPLPHYPFGLPPDPLASTFSPTPFRRDTIFTCFHLSFLLGLSFATSSTKNSMAPFHLLPQIFVLDLFGGQPSKLS